jgi:DNA-binding response OmpR family regulator
MTSPTDTTGPQDDAPLILVVDDSRVMRQALNKILRRRYQVVDAPDGMEAWTLLEQNPGIACVFTDLSMPQLDGYGLLQRIRDSDDTRLKALPVVIVTGNEDDEGTRRKAAERGANDVVMKPFRADDVLKTTEQLLAGGSAATPSTHSAEPTTQPVPEPRPDTAALANAQTEINNLREQLEHAQTQARAAVKERERLQGDMRQLRTELMLRQQTSDEREAKDRIAALEAELAQGREALEEAERTHGQLRTRLREQQEEASRAQERVEGLQGELREASAQLLERDAQVREAATAREQAQEELHALRQELEQLRQEPAEEDADEVRRLKAELESARERTGAAERALASSNGEAPAEPQGNLQARAEAAELARLQVEDELVQAISRVERLEQERETSQGEVRTLRGELNLLEKKQQELQRQEAEKRRHLEAQLSEALDALERSVPRGDENAAPQHPVKPAAGPADQVSLDGVDRPSSPERPSPQSARDTSVHRWEENQQRRRLRRNLALASVGVVALTLLAFFLGGALL